MEIETVITEHYQLGTPVNDIAKLLGVHRTTIINRARRLGLQHPGRCLFRGKIDKEAHYNLKESKVQKATQADLDALREHCAQHNLPYDSRRLWWHKTKEFSVSFYDAEQVKQEQAEQAQFLARLANVLPPVRKQPVPTKNLAIFGNFDAHVGKHCEVMRTGVEYTPDLAIKQILAGQQSLYEMSKPFGISDILLPMGNDIIHVDNNGHTSTSGTPQDAYGSVESMMYLAAEMYIRTVEAWAKTHNVWLAHVHSNHDRVAGWAVSQMVSRYFEKHPRVHVSFKNVDQRHRKYFVFGKSLIMFHHGEGKEEKLLGVIKAEASQAFWQTDRVYVYQGHTHHKQVNKRGMNTEQTEKDHSGVTVIKAGAGIGNQMHVETLRSPSPADNWHSQELYKNIPAIEVFLHNERSQFCRLTHEF
jgi:transposase